MPNTLFASAIVRRSIVLLAAQTVFSLTVAHAEGPRLGEPAVRHRWQASEPAKLPWSDDTRRSVPAAAANLALGHVQAGFRLGRRGAFYSARLEFVSALRMLAQTLDVPTGGTPHAAALAKGLRALDESDDFVPRGFDLEAEFDLPSIVATHGTPILKDRPSSELTALMALQHYYTYAQQQLAVAVGRDPVGSMALYGLARVENALGRQEPNRHPASSPKAMTLHQASLLVDNRNYAAANELGVLLVHHGHLVEARQIFQHSLDIVPTRAAWHNLAALHRKLGQPELAAVAESRARTLATSGPAPSGRQVASSPVEWLDPARFARSRPRNDAVENSNRPPDGPAGPMASDRRATPGTRRQTGKFGWLPWTRSAGTRVDPTPRR